MNQSSSRGLQLSRSALIGKVDHESKLASLSIGVVCHRADEVVRLQSVVVMPFKTLSFEFNCQMSCRQLEHVFW